jgi:hypothetical protein
VKRMSEGPAVERVDDRFNYGENRVYAIGLVNGLEITVVYSDRDAVVTMRLDMDLLEWFRRLCQNRAHREQTAHQRQKAPGSSTLPARFQDHLSLTFPFHKPDVSGLVSWVRGRLSGAIESQITIPWRLIGKKLRQIRQTRSLQVRRRTGGRLAVICSYHRNGYSNDCAVASSEPHCVPHQVNLSRIFAGNNASVRLVPV